MTTLEILEKIKAGSRLDKLEKTASDLNKAIKKAEEHGIHFGEEEAEYQRMKTSLAQANDRKRNCERAYNTASRAFFVKYQSLIKANYDTILASDTFINIPSFENYKSRIFKALACDEKHGYKAIIAMVNDPENPRDIDVAVQSCILGITTDIVDDARRVALISGKKGDVLVWIKEQIMPLVSGPCPVLSHEELAFYWDREPGQSFSSFADKVALDLAVSTFDLLMKPKKDSDVSRIESFGFTGPLKSYIQRTAKNYILTLKPKEDILDGPTETGDDSKEDEKGGHVNVPGTTSPVSPEKSPIIQAVLDSPLLNEKEKLYVRYVILQEDDWEHSKETYCEMIGISHGTYEKYQKELPKKMALILSKYKPRNAKE